MPKLARGDHYISYAVEGDGVPLVMLRGLGRSVRHWLGYEKQMAKCCRVITMDLRGIGGTSLPLSLSDRMDDMADDVVAVLDELRIDRAHILGVSLGGMVTLATGLRYPARCASLITINTSIAGQRTLRMSLRGAWAIASGLVGDKMKLHRNLADVLTSPSFPAAKKAEAARKLGEIAADDGLYPLTVLKQLLVAARFSVRRRLSQLSMPVLLIYGADDRFVPNINTRKLQSLIPHARLVSIAGAGHEIMMDQPEALRDVVAGWLDQHAALAPAGTGQSGASGTAFSSHTLA